MELDAAEFPFVVELPKREKSKLGKLWDQFAELNGIVGQHGHLMTQLMCAKLAGVSRQRIHQLQEEGILKRIEFLGQAFIGANSFHDWVRSQRTCGTRYSLKASQFLDSRD